MKVSSTNLNLCYYMHAYVCVCVYVCIPMYAYLYMYMNMSADNLGCRHALTLVVFTQVLNFDPCTSGVDETWALMLMMN